MPIPISVRPAKQNDAPGLTRLSRETFIDAFAHLNNKEDFDAYVAGAFTEKQIASEIDDSNCIFFIAETNTEWVGYAKLSRTRPPECVGQLPAIELARLYCVQKFLGSGIGQVLINTCVDYAQTHQFKSIWLGSWKENHRGNSFYRKMQFSIAGTKTFAVGSDIQEDHVFVKPLF